jgi:type I restriction enzyme S subunit
MGCVSHTKRFLPDGAKRYGGDFSETHRLIPGDIVIATRQQSDNLPILGYPAMVPASLEGRDIIAATNLYKVTNESEIDNRFLYWLLRSREYRTRILEASKGTTVRMLTKDSVEDFEFFCPPPQERKTIAAFLDVLDDKIELNRRMNASLEAMVRTLFQSWFVDFDPVRAKLDGRQPTGLDPATATLFPNEFEDSELGPIPKGWRVGTVEETLTFSRDTVDPSETPDELFAHYSLPAFDEGRTPKLEVGSAIKSQKVFVPKDAVLLSKLNPHIPRVWLPDVQADTRAVCSTEFLVAQPKSDFSRAFLFCLFTSGGFTSEYATLVTGTTGSHQRVHSESVLQMKFAIPPATLVEYFSSVAKPMFEMTALWIRESGTLASIRDALLPKLLNGDVRLRLQGVASAELATA